MSIRPHTLRATSSVISFWIAVAFAAILLGDATIRGDGMLLARVLPPTLLVIWALWMVLYRPGIRIEADRAVVINVGRRYLVPWARIVAIGQRLQVILELDDGRTLTCWGGPFPSKPGAFGRTATSVERVDPLSLLEDARQSAVPSTDAVRVRWDAVPLWIGLALTVVVVLQLAVVAL